MTQSQTEQILSGAVPESALPLRARQNLAMLADCLHRQPSDIDQYMIAAANYQLLGRSADAALMYEAALQFDHRPEIYLNLGIIQSQRGERKAAISSLLTAARFNPFMFTEEYYPELPAAIYEALAAHKVDLNLLRNGDFEMAATTRSSKFVGLGYGGSSAANQWFVYNNATGTTTTELVESKRRSGGHMLRIHTTGASNGVAQSWGTDRISENVTTSAWIFVRKGRVAVGSGNGGKTRVDAQTLTVGRWEIVSARNGSCPASHTIVVSADGPADFYIDSVRVTPTVANPCGG